MDARLLRQAAKAMLRFRAYLLTLDHLHIAGPMLTIFLVVTVTFVSITFVYPDTTDDISDAIRVSGTRFAAGTVVTALLCHFVDPGEPKADLHDPPPVNDRIRERITEGRSWTQKFCNSCRLWRPYRCGHCNICGRCVLRKDHHCLFVGACIGQGNARFFVVFLACAGIGLLHGSVMCLHCLQLGCWSGGEHSWLWLLFIVDMQVVYLLNGAMLTCGALVYTVMILADADWRNLRGCQRVAHTCRDAVKCPGVPPYCCSALSIRLSARSRVQPLNCKQLEETLC